jgi:hypothetical protein
MTPMVVSLTPPAVEPEAPPTIITPTQTKRVTASASPQLTDAKPAVRAATLWNKAANGRAVVGTAARELVHSAARKVTAAETRSRAFIPSTSLVSSGSERHWRHRQTSAATT